MIFSSSDIEQLIGGDPIIRALCSVEIVDSKPALRAGDGVVIYIKRYPDLSEFEAKWDIWIIDYDNEPVDVVIRQLRTLLPQFTVIEEGAIIKASTTELRSEKTESEIEEEDDDKEEDDPYEERFQDLLQSIEDRMLLVGPGRPGRDGKDGADGKDGEDGRDGEDLLASDAELNDLQDVFVSDANRGQFLMFDGAGWIPRFVPQVFSGGGAGSTEGGGGSGGGGTMPEPPSDGRFYLRQVTGGAGQWVDLLTALNSLTLDAGDFDGRSFDASRGQLSVTGFASFLKIIKTFYADSGTFISTGEPASLLLNRVFSLDVGSVDTAASDANILIGRNIIASPGSFEITGLSSDDIISYRILAGTGSVLLTALDAALIYTIPPLLTTISADTGSFTLTGLSAEIIRPTPVFSHVTYTGNITARSITGVGFQPSMVWINNLTGTLTHDLIIFDQRRGTGRFIRTNAPGQEYVDAQTLTSFNSDGFSLGTSPTANNSGTNRFYEAFCWKGLGSANTDTSGTITSTTQVSPAAGFSIFTYSGNSKENATVGHGLGSAPEWVLIQSRTNGFNYSAQCHSSLLSGARVWELNETAAALSSSLYIRAVSASSLTLSSNNAVNNTIITYVGYAFTSVPGVSKLGLATGDGSGVLSINVGFCPRLLIIKTYIGTGNWLLCRRTNDATGYVTQTFMNTSVASTISTEIQITANGFSINAGGDGNVSGGAESIWYMAYGDGMPVDQTPEFFSSWSAQNYGYESEIYPDGWAE